MADIIFLVDSSWSIGKEHFQLVREFLYDVVKALDVGGNDFRFALVQFSGNPHTEFQLNTYPSPQDVLSHIANMTYVGGGAEPGKGLEYLIEKHLTKAAGSRASEGVPQVIVVLTDGQPRGDVALPSSLLDSARVHLFAVGVQDAAEGQLQEGASGPLDTHRFNLENFTALHGIVGDLVASVRSSMTPGKAGAKGLVKDITGNGCDWWYLLVRCCLALPLCRGKTEMDVQRLKNKGLKCVAPCLQLPRCCLQTEPGLPGVRAGILEWAVAPCGHPLAHMA